MYVSWKERGREECEETKEKRKKGRRDVVSCLNIKPFTAIFALWTAGKYSSQA